MKLIHFAILFLCLFFSACSVFRQQNTQEYKESSISAYIATDSNERKATSTTVLSICFDTNTTGKITIPPYFFTMPNDTTTDIAKEIILEGVTNIEITHNNISEAKEFNHVASYSKSDTLSTEKITTTNESVVKKTVNYGLIIYVIIIIFVFVLYIACKKQK